MLLAEWVRRVGEEQSLIDDSTQYTHTLPNYTETTLPSNQQTNSTTWVLLWECSLTPASGKRIKLVRCNYFITINPTSGGTWYLRITAASGSDPETTILETSGTSTNVFSGIDTGFAGRFNETVYVRYYGKVSSSSYTMGISSSGGTAVRWFTPGWHLIKDYGSISLSKQSIAAFSYDVVAPSSAYGNTFIEVGAYRVGGGSVYNSETKTFNGIIVLPAGSYTVKAYCVIGTPSRSLSIKNFKLGVVAFSDVSLINVHQYSQSLSISLSSRKTCLGKTIAGNCIIYVQAYSAGQSITFADPGETPDNRVCIKVNGVQRKWSVRNQDCSADMGARGSASAILTAQLSLGEQHTIELEKSDENIVLTVSIVFSPWLLGLDDLSPVLLEFPTGSTLYVVAEPLLVDATKSIKIGRKRAVSLGGSTDYYVTQSGTGIITLAYTFDYLPTGEPLLAATGLGACISLIGVDVRA
ncbi:MAG: hypothetical protein QXM00_07590 [Candidatus Bathyarchaeia archaeon]